MDENFRQGGFEYGGAAAVQKRKDAEASQGGVINLEEKPQNGPRFAQAIPQYIEREQIARAALREAKDAGNQSDIEAHRETIALNVYKRKIAQELLEKGKLDSAAFAETLRSDQPKSFNEKMYREAYNNAVDHMNR